MQPVMDWRGDLGVGPDACRFKVLASFIPSGGSILDVGCGDALLRNALPDATYTGIDAAPGGCDIVADAATWMPEQSYDAIVFNESLYYLPNPAAQLERYGRHIDPGGVLAVSIFHKGWLGPNAAAMRAARRYMVRLRDVQTIRIIAGGLRWDVMLGRTHSLITK